MNDMLFFATLVATIVWMVILLLPWQPWRVTEVLLADDDTTTDLSDITVLIPARNEAATIQKTLEALKLQGKQLTTFVIDDHSDDATFSIATKFATKVIKSPELPTGWSGKLWALEQGRRQVTTPYILLLDADILLSPGIIVSLRNKSKQHALSLVSLMATLRMESFWEKLLIPAFVFFFKLLYPFRLANSQNKYVAAAAGGCILLKQEALQKIGGFAAVHDALIDDCSLAKKIKQAGYRIWIGLSPAVKSIRPYNSLSSIWQMVTRTAYTQLHYSLTLLSICTLMLLLLFAMFPISILFAGINGKVVALFGFSIMAICYLPTLHFYQRSFWWCLCLPWIGLAYLLMTWHSALRYWCGIKSYWKDRVYAKHS